MRRLLFAIFVLLPTCAAVPTQAAAEADVRSFELTPMAPPAPAMKYQLLFDDLSARRPGNAAVLYFESILLVSPDAKQDAEKALLAYDTGDVKTFESLAKSLDKPALFEELDLAARREQCDWQEPFREMGIRTVLPHLEPLVHGVTRLIKVRALRQIEQGNLDDALNTLRLGYELSDKTGRQPVLISGLVSLSMTASMNDCLTRLMNHPQSPNLYWALRDFPSRATILRNGLDGERGSAAATLPDLGRVEAGEDLSAGQWRAILDYVSSIPTEGPPRSAKIDVVRESSPAILSRARGEYALPRRLSADQAAKIDPIIVLGSYYFRQYEMAFDDMFKLRDLPYPLLLAKAREYTAEAAKLQREQPGNPFLGLLPTLDRAVWRFAKVDRQLAALTAVEALRTYAATHRGTLPGQLDEVTQTPVPANPVTGKPFDYRMDHNMATIFDSHSPEPLTYTVRLRNE